MADNELLALGVEHKRLINIVNFKAEGEMTKERSDELCEQIYAVEAQIMNIVPCTIAGLAVQLFVVWTSAADPSIDEIYTGPADGAMDDQAMIWGVLINAKRLATASA